jgi:peptidoglycan/LPS O-acetylase OafA/YrhL
MSSSPQRPLLHTWSLAVEEQYYLVFPLAMLLMYKMKWSLDVRFGILFVVGAASLTAAQMCVDVFKQVTG